jgi:hypothetical protein
MTPQILTAALINDFELVKRLHSEGHDIKVRISRKLSNRVLCIFTDVVILGCIHGNLELIKYAYANDVSRELYHVVTAAELGKLDCLQWLISQGCPWKFPMLHEYALSNGHLNVFNWLISEEFTQAYISGTDFQGFRLDSNTLIWAAKSKSVECVNYVVQILAPHVQNRSWKTDPNISRWACIKGSIELLQFVFDNNIALDTGLQLRAAINRNFNCFELCFTRAITLDKVQEFCNEMNTSDVTDEKQLTNLTEVVNMIDLDTELWRKLFSTDLTMNPVLHARVQEKLRELNESRTVCKTALSRYIHSDVAVNTVVRCL